MLDAVIDRIGRVTGWCSLAIVLVMAYNVLLRYFFRTGSVAMQELEWHLMAPICMLGLSYAILKDGHVQVDILYGRFPERLQRIIQFISTVLVVARHRHPAQAVDPLRHAVLQHRREIARSRRADAPLDREIDAAGRLRACFSFRASRPCCARSIPILDPSAQVKSATHTV